MAKLDAQISTLQLRLQQLKLRQQRIDERKRAVVEQRERKADIRRKILLGGIVLQRLDRGDIERGEFLSWLELALTRSADRALFGLPPLEAPQTGVESAAHSAKPGDARPE